MNGARFLRSPGLAVFGFALAFYVLTASDHLASPDGEINFRTTQSLATRGSLAIVPLSAGWVEVADADGRVVQRRMERGFASKPGRDGREYSQYGIGLPLFAVPVYWVADSVQRILPREPNPLRRVLSLTNSLVTALLALIVFAWSRDLTGNRRAALATALLFITATYAWPQAKYLYSEPLAALGLVSAAWLLDTRRGGRAGWMLLAGALAGYGILTRLDSVVAGLGFLALLWVRERDEAAEAHSALIRRTLLAALPVLLTLALIAGLNAWRFGGVAETGYGDQAEGFNLNTPLREGLSGLLFSTGRGMFIYTPLFCLVPPAWLLLWRRRRRAALGIALVTAGYVLVMAKWQNWEGGWCWGPRHIYQLTPFWAVTLAALFQEVPERFRLMRTAGLVALIPASAFVQFLGVSQDAVRIQREMGALERSLGLFNPEYSPMLYHWAAVLKGRFDFGLITLIQGTPILGLTVLAVLAGIMTVSIISIVRNWRAEDH